MVELTGNKSLTPECRISPHTAPEGQEAAPSSPFHLQHCRRRGTGGFGFPLQTACWTAQAQFHWHQQEQQETHRSPEKHHSLQLLQTTQNVHDHNWRADAFWHITTCFLLVKVGIWRGKPGVLPFPLTNALKQPCCPQQPSSPLPSHRQPTSCISLFQTHLIKTHWCPPPFLLKTLLHSYFTLQKAKCLPLIQHSSQYICQSVTKHKQLYYTINICQFYQYWECTVLILGVLGAICLLHSVKHRRSFRKFPFLLLIKMKLSKSTKKN